jgi:hypothetical protein
MQNYCNQCRESFLSEHIELCQCKQDLCCNCLALHKQGQCPEFLKGDSDSTLLYRHFRPERLDLIDKALIQKPIVYYCSSRAYSEKMTSEIWLKNKDGTLGEILKFNIEIEDYKRRLLFFDNNLLALMDQHVVTIEDAIEQFIEKHDLQNTYQNNRVTLI